MKIRTRITLYFAVLVTFLIVIRSSVNYALIKDYTNDVFYTRLKDKANIAADLLFNVNKLDSVVAKAIRKSTNNQFENQNITIYDSTNKKIYSNRDRVRFTPSKYLFEKIRENKFVYYRKGAYKAVGIYYTDSLNKAVVMIGSVDKNGDALLKQLLLTNLITIFFAIALSLILGWLFARNALSPIVEVVDKVATLSPVEKSERLSVSTEKDEITNLVVTFNKLFDRLEDSFLLQKNFVANASHELFNPLTKIKSQMEVSLLQNHDSESYKKAMQSILDDLNELIVLVHNLLNFSTIQSGSAIAYSPIRLDELLFEVQGNIQSHYPHYIIQISFGALPDKDDYLIVRGNKTLLDNALKNIIENACKFSSDKTASINLSIYEQEIVLSVTDNGPGISESEIPFIFEPFYRSPSMESVKGFGIGLALAYRIFRAHNFSIQVKSTLNMGTTFIIKFTNLHGLVSALQ